MTSMKKDDVSKTIFLFLKNEHYCILSFYQISKPFLNQNIKSRNILVEYKEIPYSPKDYDVIIIDDITIKMNFFNHLTQKISY